MPLTPPLVLSAMSRAGDWFISASQPLDSQNYVGQIPLYIPALKPSPLALPPLTVHCSAPPKSNPVQVSSSLSFKTHPTSVPASRGAALLQPLLSGEARWGQGEGLCQNTGTGFCGA